MFECKLHLEGALNLRQVRSQEVTALHRESIKGAQEVIMGFLVARFTTDLAANAVTSRVPRLLLKEEALLLDLNWYDCPIIEHFQRSVQFAECSELRVKVDQEDLFVFQSKCGLLPTH